LTYLFGYSTGGTCVDDGVYLEEGFHDYSLNLFCNYSEHFSD